jgi:hypothetical protein
MRLTWSDLLELAGAALVITAAGLWDLRALLAAAGVLLVIVGYAVGEVDE